MRLVFVKKQHEIGDVWSYFFKPQNMPEWQAGQYLNLTMPDVPPVFADRLFTIASAPHEKIIQITTIMSPSPFKKALGSLQPGDTIEADQLGGDFTWQPGRKLFIAGGIGVTPYISIIRDRLHKKEPIDALLLYAGKDERRPFINELKAAARQDKTLELREYSDTRLTLEQLRKDVSAIEGYTVYLAGSQKFSEELGEGLVAQGFPRAQIKYDYFDGYIDIEY